MSELLQERFHFNSHKTKLFYGSRENVKMEQFNSPHFQLLFTFLVKFCIFKKLTRQMKVETLDRARPTPRKY